MSNQQSVLHILTWYKKHTTISIQRCILTTCIVGIDNKWRTICSRLRFLIFYTYILTGDIDWIRLRGTCKRSCNRNIGTRNVIRCISTLQRNIIILVNNDLVLNLKSRTTRYINTIARVCSIISNLGITVYMNCSFCEADTTAAAINSICFIAGYIATMNRRCTIIYNTAAMCRCNITTNIGTIEHYIAFIISNTGTATII